MKMMMIRFEEYPKSRFQWNTFQVGIKGKEIESESLQFLTPSSPSEASSLPTFIYSNLRRREKFVINKNGSTFYWHQCPSLLQSLSSWICIIMTLDRSQKTAFLFLAIIILNLILVSDYIKPCDGKIKKKIILKKLKKLLPLLLALKPKKKKKILLLPLPLPMPMPWVFIPFNLPELPTLTPISNKKSNHYSVKL